MKLSKDELLEILKGQVNETMESDAFGEMVKSTIKEMITNLQNDVNTPFNINRGATSMIQKMPGISISDGYMTTQKGSLINLRSKQSPWVHLSDEVKTWASDFASYLKKGITSKFLSEAVDSAGGYLVPEEFRALMVMYDAEDTIVWPRATVWPMSGEKMGFPKSVQDPDATSGTFDHFAGVTFSWTEEGGTKASTEPEFGLIELIVHELAGYSEITNTLLDDSAINLMNYLTRIFRAAWYWYTDKEFIQGTGGKRPLGITNDPSVLSVARQTASNVEVADILAMEGKLPAVFDSQAVWFISKQTRANLRGQTVSAQSKELVLRENYSNLANGYDMTMLGRPCFLADGKVPTLGNPGDVIYGAWPWYYVGFRQDFALDSSRHYKFRNNRTAIRCSGRIDGQAAIPKAFVILTDAS